ncbi:MAG: hypothetical protein AAAB13_16350 [Pseudomonas sp.]
MSRPFSLLVLMLALSLWLAACYGVRFALMEDGQWVGLCVEQAQRWECQARAGLGWLIHFRVIAGAALALAVVGFLVQARAGKVLALLGLFLALSALVLYSASLAVFAVVLAGLRLVRKPVASA